MRSPAIQFFNVRFRYAGSTDSLLEDVSFTVEEGDYAAIIGENGSGKTTLLRLLLGLLWPDHGEIRLFGCPLRDFKEWGAIGYVPQYVYRRDRVFPATVWEVVESGHSKDDATTLCQFGMKNCEPVLEALRVAQVDHLAKRQIGDLSGGERQRVFIARALVSRPKLLILDEPTANVDAESAERFYGLLRSLNQEHQITIMLISHDLDRVFREAGTVFLLENGKVVLKEKPKEQQKLSKKKAETGDNEISTHTSFHVGGFHSGFHTDHF